jgi:hypothetical protein
LNFFDIFKYIKNVFEINDAYAPERKKVMSKGTETINMHMTQKMEQKIIKPQYYYQKLPLHSGSP